MFRRKGVKRARAGSSEQGKVQCAWSVGGTGPVGGWELVPGEDHRRLNAEAVAMEASFAHEDAQILHALEHLRSLRSRRRLCPTRAESCCDVSV